MLKEYADRISPSDVGTLKGDIAFAYFRIGEQQNCAAGPDATICLLPLDPAVAHRPKLGAEGPRGASSACGGTRPPTRTVRRSIAGC